MGRKYLEELLGIGLAGLSEHLLDDSLLDRFGVHGFGGIELRMVSVSQGWLIGNQLMVKKFPVAHARTGIMGLRLELGLQNVQLLKG